MRFAFVILFCCLLVGCGSGSPYSYKKVSGKLTYEDGSPLPVNGLKLRFVAMDAPQVEGASPRPAFAVIDGEGNFDCVTSYKYGDGLIPGRHKVSIEREGISDTKPAVSKEFLSATTSPIVVNTDDAPFEIKVPKPTAKR